jgi:hypothetical protein
VAGCRIYQRHLHDPLAHAGLILKTTANLMRLKAQPPGWAFFALQACNSVYTSNKVHTGPSLPKKKRRWEEIR